MAITRWPAAAMPMAGRRVMAMVGLLPPLLLLVALLPVALHSQPVPDSGGGFAWSVYYPRFQPHPPESYVKTSVRDMVLVLGGNATHPALITQDFSGYPIRSGDGGFTWAPMCRTSGAREQDADADADADTEGTQAPQVTPWAGRPAGIGQLADGTLLIGTGTRTSTCAAHTWAANCTLSVFIFRVTVSAAGHCGWASPHQLPTMRAQQPCHPCRTAPRCDNVGGDASNRFRLTAAGTIYYTGTNLRTPASGRAADALPRSEQYDYSVAYRSSDMGATFAPVGVIGRGIAEVDILAMPPPPPPAPIDAAVKGAEVGVEPLLLASLRYQQSGGSSDTTGGYFAPFYKQTAISRSTNGGASWETPGMVTGYLQQTGSLALLADGKTLVLAFGHKDDAYDEATKTWVMYGQRFIVSYDFGRSFSRTIFDLAVGGMYAATVALPLPPGGSALSVANQTIVSVCANSTGVAGNLHVLRWHVPPQSDVAAGGFFEPVTPSCPSPSTSPSESAHHHHHGGGGGGGGGKAASEQQVAELLAENARLRGLLRTAGIAL
jgi:hypothetical protein